MFPISLLRHNITGSQITERETDRQTDRQTETETGGQAEESGDNFYGDLR